MALTHLGALRIYVQPAPGYLSDWGHAVRATPHFRPFSHHVPSAMVPAGPRRLVLYSTLVYRAGATPLGADPPVATTFLRRLSLQSFDPVCHSQAGRLER